LRDRIAPAADEETTPMNSTTELLSATPRGTVLELTMLCEMVSAEAGQRLQSQFERTVAARARETRRVRLEVSRVVAMSSAGFEALLRLHRTCKDAGIELVMTPPTAEFLGLLTRMGFDRLFAIESRTTA
jgi:anti-anti-sigma regulatory factor